MSSGTANTLIRLSEVGYRYGTGSGRPVIDRFDLTIEPGRYHLICGGSGSGKSTLCRTFNGLIPHFYRGTLTGRVEVAGRDTRKCSVADLFSRVAMVFQNPEAQLFNASVEREIAYGLESLGMDRGDIGRRIVETARLLDITDLLTCAPHQLSGGQQQLAAIAAMIALNPDVLVLDEPFAHLDPIHVRYIRQVLENRMASGAAVVVCEHRLGPTLPDTDQITVLHRGRIRAAGATDTVLTDPRLAQYGLELPLAVRIGRHGHLSPMPRTIEDLPAAAVTDPVDLNRPALQVHTDGPAVLSVDHVSADLAQRTVVRKVSFALHAGEAVAVVGANGAGKTSLVRLMAGLMRPRSGCIRIKGRNIAEMKASQVARHVGTAFQNPNSQFFKLTVSDEIRVGPRALDCLDEDWIGYLVDLFGLYDLMERAPFRLSSGEKKRVAFAAALAAKPALICLDEPTAGQDGHFRQSLGRYLERLQLQGQTVVIVTHDLNFAQQQAPRWLVMADGRLRADGPPDQIMADDDLMAGAGLVPTDRFLFARKVSTIDHLA